MSNPVAEVFDVFFNGRRAPKPEKAVNWPELIRRKESHVLVGGKCYRVTVEAVKLTAETKK